MSDCYSFDADIEECYTFESSFRFHTEDCYTFISHFPGDDDEYEEDEEEEDEEEIIEVEEEIDFKELGFTAIKCIQSHGFDEIVVIGLYLATQESEEVAIIARILYTRATIGGVGALNGILFQSNLSEYGISYNDVYLLESWDMQSSSSDLCIVCNNNLAIYIDGLIFTEKNRVVDPRAIIMPFWEEDSYGALRTRGDYHIVCTNGDIKSYQLYYGIYYPDCPEECLDSESICAMAGDPCVKVKYYDDECYEYTRKNAFNVKSISSGEESIYDCSHFLAKVEQIETNTPSCVGGTQRVHLGSMENQRDGVIFSYEGRFFLGEKEPEWQIAKHSQIDDTAGCGLSLTYERGFGVIVEEDDMIQLTGLPNDPVYFGKFMIDTEYYAVQIQNTGTTKYIKKDGTIEGEIASINTTIISGVALIADNSAIVEQIVLDDIEEE